MTYVEVGPRSRAVAEALLAAAEAVGDARTSVRTTIRGYLVSEKAAAYYRKMQAGETEPVVEEPLPATEPIALVPDESWKVADIRAYAEANGIELNGYVKKADLLAAITADTKEE